MYSNCVFWLIYCIIKRTYADVPNESQQDRLRRALQIQIPQPGLDWLNRAFTSRLSYLLVILVWGLCFVYHIYIYSLFLNYRLVSQTWTFGQIIAVTVWAPSIVEFFYTDYGKSTKTDSNQTSFPADKGKPEGPEEASKYKYPPGLQVFRSTIRPSIGLANLEPFQRTSRDLYPQDMTHLTKMTSQMTFHSRRQSPITSCLDHYIVIRFEVSQLGHQSCVPRCGHIYGIKFCEEHLTIESERNSCQGQPYTEDQ